MKDFGEIEIHQLSKAKQWFSALVAAFGGVGLGLSLSWTATALPSIQETHQIKNDLSVTEKSLIGALLTCGALIACPFTAFAMNNFGRKSCMIYLSALAIPGWLILAAAKSSLHLYIGRVLTGIYAGGCTIVVPVYIKELSSTENRGVLGSLFMIMLCVGKLISNGLGVLLDSSTASLICTIQPALHAILILLIPESQTCQNPKVSTLPNIVLVSAGTNSENIDAATSRSGDEGKVKQFKSKFACSSMPSLTAFVLALLAQLCGINVATFFTNEMLDGDTFATIINPKVALVTLTAIQLVGGLPASILVDRLGRKCLLLSSLVAMAFSMAVLSTHFFYLEDISILYPEMTVVIPLVFLSVYNVSYSWGVGSIIWIIISEIIPSQIIAFVSSIAYALYWISAFLIILFYQLFAQVCPLYIWFLGFSLVSLCGGLFVTVCVPETKGLRLDEIQKRYKSKYKNKKNITPL